MDDSKIHEFLSCQKENFLYVLEGNLPCKWALLLCNHHLCFHVEWFRGPFLVVDLAAPSTTKVRKGAQQRNATLTGHLLGAGPHFLGKLLDHGREPQLLPLPPHVPHRPRLEPHHLLSSLAHQSWDFDLPFHQLFLISAFPSPIDTSVEARTENMAHHSDNGILRLVRVESLHQISNVFSIPPSPHSSRTRCQPKRSNPPPSNPPQLP